MLDKIAKVVEHYEELEKRMADPEILADYQKVAELAQERSEMEPLVESYRRHQAVSEELQQTIPLVLAIDEDEQQ